MVSDQQLTEAACIAETARSVDERLIRLPHVLAMVGLGKTMLYSLVRDGEFPRPRKVRHAALWFESEVEEWIRSVVEQAPAQGVRDEQ
ncbi:hypothetical protein P350_13270 [Burkholderia cepacia JBK9]|nr:hypothetical protein P350_13270 [Burkholderia cepacia JBK9]